ncbi:bifunctional proline dehydrogenase/L-glutamate gamma-semialdehyde dehydrogenase PutA [Pseudovibrio sp. Tun.PSC04-5.I4]|uniref:bifunctional proline dehydrogenase/L-glutamate gamma-semialdehyde dehydrogenase PutA n=1 Tax=Pseudovibrio sp. Tun.PSC04-5.I4 TaxID=1798213 RepID=UPI00088FF643|nr:bifunctional proline dehydrogenase/L-glutamate gamma-semialdehyde dehydrogenase PutA [Pseudovibrio sp. Tun.PSC04-5.I4]SDQ72059.1 L-proline dehydrogenase /delta-1-pyrroline-5-carboxylate dehydrogenase [Pseudovibrio sp. Tun.PSC04-5.I4]
MGSEATPETIRKTITDHYFPDENQVVRDLISSLQMDEAARDRASKNAAKLIEDLRANTSPTIMESFLGEYGLSTQEGIALMCLAEALLRVPDAQTIDALIADKITPSAWGEHLGQSSSTLINASTWALLLTGKVLAPDDRGLVGTIRGVVKRMGEPVVRTAVAQAMKELGRQFVLGRTIREAMRNARVEEGNGFTYSYDMLGEAARTDADAKRYHLSYSKAISALSSNCNHASIRQNPGISVKLSALHPRYEFAKRERVMKELVPRTLSLIMLAKSSNMGFNIDAEEADRLDLSLDVIEALLADPSTEGWDGFGVVVQAFGPRAIHVIDWLYATAEKYDRKIMIRLVKGAYWDSEIKRAQTLGIDGYPVFTRKVSTDISYTACAEKLLGMTDRIYPQFATHNAHSVASVLELAKNLPLDSYEFQRLHGMGEALHERAMKKHATNCRIYAPVGAHKDLLAYLVRRLLENGANSSFVHQIRDTNVSPTAIAQDPLAHLGKFGEDIANSKIALPPALYGSGRKNAKGWDLSDPRQEADYVADLEKYSATKWQGHPVIAASVKNGEAKPVKNPADLRDVVGDVASATPEQIEAALTTAHQGCAEWSDKSPEDRAVILRKAADLYEENSAEIFALLTREAGKTYMDAIGELREAVDFARYYANEAIRLEERDGKAEARGPITCISPWNFPLAIFSGQIFAALAAGNPVLAKPAPQTPLIATFAAHLMHKAGIPVEALQLLPGGGDVGAALTSDPRVAGVCFTGSTATAQHINRAMAKSLAPSAPLIAETGGLNAMIVDSTALPEQAVRDVIVSSFQSAGQRCSALRMLFVQEDIFEDLKEMLFGAMDELELGNPAILSTDVGPVIDAAAQAKISAHCEKWAAKGRVLKQMKAPQKGHFVGPTLIHLEGIEELEEEIFGPVLHIATFKADEIDKTIDAINAQGYGLTFGLHTRVDSRVQHIVERVKVGNLYVNRNQIGAIVGSQPFGGEGLSGTGPKAGGPHYVSRFRLADTSSAESVKLDKSVSAEDISKAHGALRTGTWTENFGRFTELATLFVNETGLLNRLAVEHAHDMPGPTGESNRLYGAPRGTVLCLGPDAESLQHQAVLALAAGNGVIAIGEDAEKLALKLRPLSAPIVAIEGQLNAGELTDLQGIDAVAANHTEHDLKLMKAELADRNGALMQLITERNQPERYQLERHLCIDTTAAGGNASLLAAVED